MNKKETKSFLKNVLTMFSGTSIAQIINFGALIILQRYFYSPEEYAPFRLFFEFTVVFSSISALRLESGLILERDKNKALSLLRVCIRYCIMISIIGGVIFTLYFIKEIEVFQYEWILLALMPFAIFGNGIIQISQPFFTRTKQFVTITSSRIIHSLAGSLTQIITGLIGFNFIGLIIGRITGLFSANLNYIRKFFKTYSWIRKNKKEEKALIKKHRNFIWYTSPGVFVGNSINLLTLILFTHYYGEQFTGLTAAAIQYLGLICMIFSNSFAQVYYNEIAQINKPKQLISSYTYWIKRLAFLSVSGLIVLFFIPNSFVTSILGNKWIDLMSIIKIISPWMGIMFISSSLSFIFIRLGKQKEIFFFDLFHLVLVISTILLSQYILEDKIKTLYFFTGAQCIFYVLSILIAFYFMKKAVIKNEI